MTTRSFVLGISALAAAILPTSASAEGLDSYKRDIVILTDWFEGEFDNEEQRWFQGRNGVTEEERHDRLHVMHRRLDLPQFGEHVFYVEEYKDHDPEQIIRQRLVIFLTDPENNAIRMRQGFFKDAQSVKGGYADPSKLANLTPDDVQFIEDLIPTSNCDVFWRRVAGQFEGSIPGKGCVFGEGARERYSIHNMILSEDHYWRADLTRLTSDDSISVGYPEDQPHKMRRALPFICSGRFFPDPNATFDEGKGTVQSYGDVRIHSQGGSFRVTRQSDGQEFEGLLRTKAYPYYDERPDFYYFSFRKAGEERSVVFTVNDIDARIMGSTIPGISVMCHREGYTFNQPHELLPEG